VVACVVPRVVGLAPAKAKARIRSRHCSVGRVTKAFSALRKKGKVLSQAPKPGKRLRRGARVNMVVGKGPRRT
jgi:beta-lactam-binding protein with PASTA domain